MNKPPTRTTVPDHWKHENGGPYRQAPPEYGGEWWTVSPFTASGTTDNASPWERFAPQAEPEALPEGFEAIFGKMPEFKDFTDSAAWTTARNHWRQNLAQFRGPLKSKLEGQALADLEATYEAWGMGKPRFYGGRYAEMVRWPDSQVQDFEASAFEAEAVPHHVIARYQIALANSGGEIPEGQRHPFVPPFVFGD